MVNIKMLQLMFSSILVEVNIKHITKLIETSKTKVDEDFINMDFHQINVDDLDKVTSMILICFDAT